MQTLSALADKIGLARRAAARIQREIDAELLAIDQILNDLTIWTEEDPTRRNALEARLKANDVRLENLAAVTANRDEMQAEYDRRNPRC